ncbi:ABC transporter ATP-binding protein [bacterium]|nr:MAG: ABC transporter ATP-binding protein [bacterium]
MAKALEVKNLTKQYGKLLAVDSVSFEVGEGEIFALIGSNGAGKSTALRVIATIIQPTGGTVSIYGLDAQKESAKIRQIISYLPEEAGAYKNLTGVKYLEFMAALYSDDNKIQKQYVDDAMEITGLKDRLRDKIKTYSKGMTRKLLLARTVMTKPRLAILDEPTSGLDVINATEIRKIIRGLAKTGMAVLLSSHNMLEIEYLSDRVAFINQGRIIETGTAPELKAKHGANNLEEVFTNLVK